MPETKCRQIDQSHNVIATLSYILDIIVGVKFRSFIIGEDY